MIKIIKIFCIFYSLSSFGAITVYYNTTFIFQSCSKINPIKNCHEKVLIPKLLDSIEMQCIDYGCFGHKVYDFENEGLIHKAIFYINRDFSAPNSKYMLTTHIYSLDGASFTEGSVEIDLLEQLPQTLFFGPWRSQEDLHERTVLKISKANPDYSL